MVWCENKFSLYRTSSPICLISFPKHPSIRDFSFHFIGSLVHLQKLFTNFWYPRHLGSMGVRGYGSFWNLNLFNQNMSNFLNIAFKNFMAYFITFEIHYTMIFIYNFAKHIFDKFLFFWRTKIQFQLYQK